MKLPTQANSTESTLSPIVSTDFKVKVTGTTFRVLFDQLYQNKIRAVVRELSTNAYDSHCDAGVGHLPFDIHLPTRYEPEFYVRDYGTGMSHQTVMTVYSSAFDSLKRDTNDQVGYFGLGSKSPFAYGDSFTVSCYDGKEERLYVATLGSDSIPELSLLAVQPSLEPTGVRVGMSVSDSDYETFRAEAASVLRYFPVVPNGVTVPTDEPVLAGEGWSLFKGNGNGQILVKQGPIVYPTSFKKLLGTHTLIVNFHMGSLELTPSREALSLSEQTQQTLRDGVDSALKSLEAARQERIDACSTMIEAMRFNFQNLSPLRDAGSPRWRGREMPGGWLYLLSGSNPKQRGWPKDVPPPVLRSPATWKEVKPNFHIGDLADIHFYIDSDEKIVRRRQRVTSRDKGHYVLSNPHPKTIATLMRRLAIGPDQFSKISDLPDPGKPIRAANSFIRGVYKLEGGIFRGCDSAPSGDWLWISTPDSKDKEPRLPLCGRSATSWVLMGMLDLLEKFGRTERSIYLLTPQALKRFGDPARSLDMVVSELLTQHKQALIEAVIGWDYPEIGISSPLNLNTSAISLASTRYGAEVETTTKSHKEMYPLLYNRDSEAVAEYIELMDFFNPLRAFKEDQ